MDEWTKKRKVMVRLLRALTIASVVWLVVSLAFRPVLTAWLEGKGYSFDILLFVGWALAYLCSGGRTVVTQVLRSAGRYRLLTLQGLLGASLSLVLIPIGIALFGAAGAVLALAAVEATAMALGMRAVRVASCA
jgi:O-antigen/teichoic acid export membrane protein